VPFYEKGDVRIRYEEAGSGFPLLVMPGGGLNSRISNWATAPPGRRSQKMSCGHVGGRQRKRRVCRRSCTAPPCQGRIRHGTGITAMDPTGGM
jgi:hypothetical protein